MADGPETDGGNDARRAREQGAARAVRRRRRGDVSRAVSEAVERAGSAGRPHDCTIEVRAGGVLGFMLPSRRLPGWSLGAVEVTGSAGSVANFALGSDGRLYWNAASRESRGIGTDGRFATRGAFGPSRLRDDLEVLDGVMRLLEGQQPPS